MLGGGVQLIVTLVVVISVTVGVAGLPGGSCTSVTVTMSVLLTDNARAPAPLVAVTVTTYTLFPAAFAGVVLCTSVGFSKSGAEANVTAPFDALMENFALSEPPLIV